MKLYFNICAISWLCQYALVSYAQSFLEAISQYPQLSNFTNLLTQHPGLTASLQSGSPSTPLTVLVPNNNAFAALAASNGQLPDQAFLESAVPYHVLDGMLNSQNFTVPKGITVPTALTGPKYDNRTAGPGLESAGGGASTGSHNGQVVFIALNTTSTSFSRRNLGSASAYVQSGLGHQVNLTALDGQWYGGLFHMIDGFLTLPEVCTDTIQAWGLSSLDASLEKTGLGSFLDTFNNVTCLGPNNKAFLNAGSPDVKLDLANLSKALAFHTIPMPLYSNFLEDGQTFTSLSNDSVRVTLKSGEIYFNDAKVLQLNVLTNNGLMHVLDRIMAPLSTSASVSPTTTTKVSATPSSTITPARNSTTTTTALSTPTQLTGAASSKFAAADWNVFQALCVMYAGLFLTL